MVMISTGRCDRLNRHDTPARQTLRVADSRQAVLELVMMRRRLRHIKAVADLLGHSSIAITGDVYGHTSDETARTAVDDWSSALGL
jgi:integrase